MESKMAQCGCDISGDGRVTNGIDEMETAETVANFNPDSTNSILPASAPVPVAPRAPAPAPTPAPEPELPEGCPVDKPNYVVRTLLFKKHIICYWHFLRISIL